MSAYDGDDRVVPYGNGFAVGDLAVLPSGVFGWAICHADTLTFVQTAAGPAVGYRDADDALHALIGGPR